MIRILPFLLLLLCGCFRARVDVELLAAGDGSIGVQLGLDRSKIPSFFGDPLAGVGTPEDLRRYTGPGIVGWAEPVRARREGWETITLRAYFDDIRKLRFLREREDGQIAELLRFEYEPQRRPGELTLLHDLVPELSEPMPIPEQSTPLDPDMLRQAVGMMKPLLGDLELSLRVHLPGQVQSAPGFHQLSGRDAMLLAERDQVLGAVTERAGSLLDEAAFLGARPPRIVWRQAAETPAERERHDRSRRRALEWWAEELARADSGR